MLVFIDESGTLHPSDPSPRASLCAVCIPEHISRTFNQSLRDLVKTAYPAKEPLEMELKAEKYLARKPYEYSVQRREVVRGLTDLLRTSPIAVFAIQMRRPDAVPNWPKGTLSPHYRLLIERVELFMRENEPDGFAKILFDERDPGADAVDSRSMRTFISDTAEGHSWSHVLDTPFFVSSSITPGIQAADIMAGAARHFIELRDAGSEFSSEWERAIEALQVVARSKTRDFVMAGYTYYGMYFMPDRYYEQPPGPRPLWSP